MKENPEILNVIRHIKIFNIKVKVKKKGRCRYFYSVTWKGNTITHFNGKARKSVFVSDETV